MKVPPSRSRQGGVVQPARGGVVTLFLLQSTRYTQHAAFLLSLSMRRNMQWKQEIDTWEKVKIWGLETYCID